MTVPMPATGHEQAVGRWRVARMLATAGRAAVALLVLAVPLLARPPWWLAATVLVVTVTASRGAARQRIRSGLLPAGVDALDAVRADAAWCGGGAFIGIDAEVGVVHAPVESACLVLGPPRRGKTSAVIIPSVLCAPGAALVTSTKPDVLMATAAARSRYGRVYAFDPTGQSSDLPDGVIRLRWSPLDAAGTWESARRLASAMVAASPAAKGTRHESHWTSRAAALLGPLLYTAALSGRDMVDVVGWVLKGDTKTAQKILGAAADDGLADAILASQVLEGVDRAADQERQSIWSATADVIDVYTTAEALEAATCSNFDPASFVYSADTVYIAAAAEQQNACAPLVVALIEAVRDAQYRRHRAATIAGQACWPPVSLILDEVANVAPIASLPALVSEAGGQGLHVLAAIQDLSQVRGRWGADVADGFLSLFGHVLVLGGIRDTRTLEALSVMCGEWTNHDQTIWRPWISPGAIYGLASNQALYLWGASWSLIGLAPHFAHPRWRAALAAAPERLCVWDPLPASPPSVLSRVCPSRHHWSRHGRGRHDTAGAPKRRSLCALLGGPACQRSGHDPHARVAVRADAEPLVLARSQRRRVDGQRVDGAARRRDSGLRPDLCRATRPRPRLALSRLMTSAPASRRPPCAGLSSASDPASHAGRRDARCRRCRPRRSPQGSVWAGGGLAAGQGPPSGGPVGTRSALDARSPSAFHHGPRGPGTGPHTPTSSACPRPTWRRPQCSQGATARAHCRSAAPPSTPLRGPSTSARSALPGFGGGVWAGWRTRYGGVRYVWFAHCPQGDAYVWAPCAFVNAEQDGDADTPPHSQIDGLWTARNRPSGRRDQMKRVLVELRGTGSQRSAGGHGRVVAGW
ncbi:MAG: type IV secretory system conjugative DNA transfer family protein [Egibacteraceae bacterium]